MKHQEDKRDPFIKSIFEEGGLEQPSADFSHQILNAIKSESKDSVFVYKPVISRTVWIALTFVGLSLFIYLFFGYSPASQGADLYGFKLHFDLSPIQNVFSKIAFSFQLSPILKTSLMALSFFIFSNLVIFELKSRSFFK